MGVVLDINRDVGSLLSPWSTLAHVCQTTLGNQELIVARDCHTEGHSFVGLWCVFSALAAEALRTFNLLELCIATELHIYRVSQETFLSNQGPIIDNGGLLPDNRREISFRIFVPAGLEGIEEASSACAGSIAVQARDGEESATYSLQAGRIFLWWSRQTFHKLFRPTSGT